MPLGVITTAKDQGNRTVRYQAPNGHNYAAKVEKMSVQAAAPAAPTPATSTTGGTLAAGTYTYRLTKVIDDVETQASAQATQATTGSTSTVTLTWTNDPNATQYKVYGRSGTEQLLTTLPAGSTTFVDTGALTPSGALPTALGANAVHLRIIGYKGASGSMLKGGVLPATALKQADRYYIR